MSNQVSAAVAVGRWSIDSGADAATELLEIETRARLGTPEPVCRIAFYSPPAGGRGVEAMFGAASGGPSPGGAPAAGGPIGTSIRGHPVASGDPITIDFAAGDRRGRVASAEVDEIRSSAGRVSVLGRGALQRLAATRMSRTYENQTLRQIVEDLAGRVGVATGELGPGTTYPRLLVHESRSVLQHVLDLAAREGMDVYEAPDGSLTVKPFRKSRADHVLRYGAEVLDFRLGGIPPGERVVAYGESPASREGQNSWYWLAKDISPFSGRSGGGHVAVAVADGAIRSKDAAENLAASLRKEMGSRALNGHARVLGNPLIRLGDAVEVADAPRPELGGTFKVRAVRHRFGRRTGFVTEIELRGLGAEPAEAGSSTGGAGP